MLVEVNMKKFILLFTICLLALPVHAAYDYAKNGFQPLLTANSFDKVSQVEQTILGHTYDNQHISLRLNRLEQVLFNKTYPKHTYEQRINNIIMNYRNGSNFSGLSKLEQKVFDNIYNGDTPENRITRLEQETMGTIQSGDLISRYKNLQRVVPKYHSNRLARQYGGIPIMSTGGGWRGLAGSLGNFFNSYSGYPTGYTPPIFSPYPNYYQPDFQQNIYSNHGWGYNNSNLGTGSGVHILD